MMDEQAELDEMARESMFALNRENGMTENEARELEVSVLQEPAGGMESESETLQRIYKGMTGEEAEELTQMGDVNPESKDLESKFDGTIYMDGTLSNDKLSAEDQSEPEIDISGEQGQGQDYQDFFARLIDSMAQIVGPDTELGSRLSDFADELEGNNVDGEQFRSDVDPDYYDLNKLNQSESGRDTVPFVEKGQDPESDRENITDQKPELHLPKEQKDAVSRQLLKFGEDDAKSDDKLNDLQQDVISPVRKKLFKDTMDQFRADPIAWKDGSPQKQRCADEHLGVLRGLETYNRAAKECIQETYSDDPEKMQQAIKGLERTMEAMVMPIYDVTYQNDKNYNFLSDKDKQELDNMHFDGMDVSYSEFAAKKDHKFDPLAMYANAGLDDPIESGKQAGEPESGSTKKGTDKPLESKSKPKDRGAEAEQEFASQLEKFKEQQSGLSISL